MKNILLLAILSFSFLGLARAGDSCCALESPEARLAAANIVLPEVPTAIANYVPTVRSGNIVFLAGQIAKGSDGKFITGKVGVDLTLEEGAAAARICAIQLIAALKAEIGDLSKVKRIVRVGGYVNCPAAYTAQSKVVNGASDLLVEIFGDAGRHARVALGAASLPAGAPVEIEMMVEIADCED